VRTVDVTLGGRKYTITELPSRQNAEWRQQLAEPFGELASLLESAMDLELSGPNVARIIRSVSSVFIESADTLVELLFSYSPELEKDRAYIQDHAYDSEIMTAFLEVLKLAYPFGSLVERIGSLGIGSTAEQTTRN